MTFVEVLATLLLIAIVLPVVMKGISLCTSTASASRQRIEVATMAESRLVEITTSGQWRLGELRGTLSPDHPQYLWTLEVREWTQPGVQQLTLHVEDTMNSRYVFNLSTLVRGGGRR